MERNIYKGKVLRIHRKIEGTLCLQGTLIGAAELILVAGNTIGKVITLRTVKFLWIMILIQPEKKSHNSTFLLYICLDIYNRFFENLIPVTIFFRLSARYKFRTMKEMKDLFRLKEHLYQHNLLLHIYVWTNDDSRPW